MKTYLHAGWHGLGAALIALATAAATYRTPPQGWDQLILGVGVAIAFWKGADSYLTPPTDHT